MKRKYKTVALIIALLCGFVWVYLYRPRQEVPISDSSEQLESLQMINDSLHAQLIAIAQDKDILEKKTDSLSGIIIANRNRISNLTNKKNEEHTIIDHYDGLELYEFFSRIKTDSAALRK